MTPQTRLVVTPLTPLSGSTGQGAAEVVVEVEEADAGIVRASRPAEIAATAVRSLAESFDQVRAAAEVALDRLKSMSVSPSSIELELGVKLNAEVGAVIARTAGEGNFVLRLVWDGGHGADGQGG
ncbi:CU044_2847 family protein [Streptantibioticus cattleyicolor]|uniref:CU044_2847 family protein n=1 Tax=Streptantibioticus cattleyicolor TaxID=29303 RepID=UPI000213E995|nr:CU044_2847 family protein [Streptantibioticus cattleyicolor]CCB71310.1 protein of unknown function [Streptantibioticus cattleyicolor NRRL 8057 = DSM 46488]